MIATTASANRHEQPRRLPAGVILPLEKSVAMRRQRERNLRGLPLGRLLDLEQVGLLEVEHRRR